ncbi:NAD(P)-dependent oxidoreductase [Francisella sp. 19X1-34]|uniref:NAD(P)-dependent oxidoreductase n=1 Tax=Francisella sp. 19X1-34 TaxID=3087177 RepID=UPI002E31685C|nr:NAD(P)-dependent oxidoreductase [Francisella sp. 19X1-34]MED7787945.1 NAD(P)-dependent oxidoreductase [Francisella sp. 19X1-34]
MKNIVIIEPIGMTSEQESKLSGIFKGHSLTIFDSRGYDDQKLLESLSLANIIILTNRVLSYDVISQLDHLEFISVAFSGTDHINAEAIQEKGIVVKNSAGYANSAVAELTIGFMVCLARDIVNNNNNMANGIATNTGTELKGKKLGIVGYGNIGKKLESLADAFGMQTIKYNSKSTLDDLESLFKQSDFISLNIPLNSDTRGMINKHYFNLMKPSAYLINCARGPIVNQHDLIEALDNKKLKSAAIDVFDIEPPLQSNHILLNRDDIIATPHIGFNTQEALVSKANMAIEHVINYLND